MFGYLNVVKTKVPNLLNSSPTGETNHLLSAKKNKQVEINVISHIKLF